MASINIQQLSMNVKGCHFFCMGEFSITPLIHTFFCVKCHFFTLPSSSCTSSINFPHGPRTDLIRTHGLVHIQMVSNLIFCRGKFFILPLPAFGFCLDSVNWAVRPEPLLVKSKCCWFWTWNKQQWISLRA